MSMWSVSTHELSLPDIMLTMDESNEASRACNGPAARSGYAWHTLHHLSNLENVSETTHLMIDEDTFNCLCVEGNDFAKTAHHPLTDSIPQQILNMFNICDFKLVLPRLDQNHPNNRGFADPAMYQAILEDHRMYGYGSGEVQIGSSSVIVLAPARCTEFSI